MTSRHPNPVDRPARDGRFRFWRSSLRFAMAATLGGGILAACGSSSHSGAASSGGAAAFFKGKTITLIAPDKPGGGYDKYARLFAPYLASALGATINVVNVNGAGTLDGTNEMAKASPDGLTIGLVNVGGDTASLVEHLPGQSFDMTKLSWIGQPAVVPNVMVTQPSSSVKSFASMLSASSPVSVLDVRSGVGDMLNRVVFGAMSIPHHLVTGFDEVAALKQGFLAKDGQIMFESIPSMYSLIAGHEARPLLYVGTLTLPKYRTILQGVPDLASELAKAKLSSAQKAAVKEALTLSNLSDDFAGPPGIPAARLQVLRQAFLTAAKSSALQAAALKASIQVGPIDGATLATQVSQAVAQGSAIGPFVPTKG